ncbi:MAG: ComEC/Rec2 family competence protein [Hominenteromicrobium sp.]
MWEKGISRPAAVIGFTYFAALLLTAFLGAHNTPYVLGALLIALLLCFFSRQHRSRPALVLALFTAAAATAVFTLLSWFSVLPVERYIGNTYRIQAVILSEADHDYGNFYYKARVTRIEEPDQAVDFTIRLSHGEALNAEVGDTLSCTVKFVAFEDRFGLSSRTAQLAGGKVLAAYITDYGSVSITPAAKKPLAYYSSAVRAQVRDRILRAYPKAEGSVLCAMLLGLRNDLSDSLSDAYRAAGASHILVISGMHMAIIAQFALGVLSLFGIRKRWAAGLSVLFVLAFMVISGMSATVVRSGIMQIILLFGLLIGRQADPLNSLAIAVLCLTLQNPFCVGDISLLLSFSATLGMLVLSPRMLAFCTKRIRNPRRRIRLSRLLAPVTVSAGAILGALPVQLYAFGTVNFNAIVTALLVLYASAWLIRFGILAALCLSVPFLAPAAAPFVLLSGLLAKYQNAVVFWIADHLPGTLEISGAYLPAAVLICLLFFALAVLLCGRYGTPAAVYVLAACILLSGMAANEWLNGSRTRIMMLDSDYAQCTALIEGHSASVLSCSGNGSKVRDTLKDYGVRTIGFLLVSSEESAIRCAETLADAFPISAAAVPDTVCFPAVGTDTVNYHYGCTGKLPNGTEYTVSADGGRVRFSVCGKTVVLENQNGGYEACSADILITENMWGLAEAPFTVLKTDAIIEEAAADLPAGDYILTSEHELLCLDFEADGRYTILGG